MRECVKKRRRTVIAALVASAVIAACLFVLPREVSAPSFAESLCANYIFDKQVYMNPLSSFLAYEGFKEYYTLERGSFLITDAAGGKESLETGCELSWLGGSEFSELFIEETEAPDVSSYERRYQLVLSHAKEGRPGYRIFIMDGEIWLAKLNAGRDDREYILSIYGIKRFEGELPGC